MARLFETLVAIDLAESFLTEEDKRAIKDFSEKFEFQKIPGLSLQDEDALSEQIMNETPGSREALEKYSQAIEMLRKQRKGKIH